MSEKKNPLPSPARPGSMFGLLGIASTMGMHMISGPLAGGGIGWLVDRQLDSWPVGFGIGILLGIAAGFRNVWVDARRLERGQAEIDAAQAAERESRTAAAPGGEGRRNPGVPKRRFCPKKSMNRNPPEVCGKNTPATRFLTLTRHGRHMPNRNGN